ncbi:MAG: hypothetical protein PF638_09570 [Candidatus Delongbacteria bacterium]|jgi:hypothetical protein|nr:hypothetical protein [Candidatus Delongbacteria bacterium]
MKIKIIFWVGIIVLGLWYYYDSKPITYGHGQIAPKTPVQKLVSKKAFKLEEDYEVLPLATFDITARVLSTERYWLDKEAKLAPVDFALGWGPMSDEKVLDKLKISQRNRWFYWSCKELPISQSQIMHNSANMHLIPANDEIDTKIKSTKTGNLVKFKGFLPKITGEDGWWWQSSLSRTDVGNGACEVVYVEEFEIISKEEVLKRLK